MKLRNWCHKQMTMFYFKASRTDMLREMHHHDIIKYYGSAFT